MILQAIACELNLQWVYYYCGFMLCYQYQCNTDLVRWYTYSKVIASKLIMLAIVSELNPQCTTIVALYYATNIVLYHCDASLVRWGTSNKFKINKLDHLFHTFVISLAICLSILSIPHIFLISSLLYISANIFLWLSSDLLCIFRSHLVIFIVFFLIS